MDMMEAQPEQWQRTGEKLRYWREIWGVELTGSGIQWVWGEEGRVWRHAFILALGTQDGVEDINQGGHGRWRCWIWNSPLTLILNHAQKFFNIIFIWNMDLP